MLQYHCAVALWQTLSPCRTQQWIEHCPKLPRHFNQNPGCIDHRDRLAARLVQEHVEGDRLDLRLDPVEQWVKLGCTTRNIIASRATSEVT